MRKLKKTGDAALAAGERHRSGPARQAASAGAQSGYGERGTGGRAPLGWAEEGKTSLLREYEVREYACKCGRGKGCGTKGMVKLKENVGATRNDTG